MKTTDFIVENANLSIQEDTQQMAMLKEECYHLAHNAVALHKLLGALPDDTVLDAWAAEYIAIANDHIATVKEWLEYDVKGHSPMTSFDADIADRQLAESLGDADFAQLRKDADAGIKASLDKQSNARIAALKNPPKPKSFMSQVGDKIIGGVKGAAKGFAGGTDAIKEDASAGSSSSGGVSVVMSQLGETPTEMIKRQKSYTNQLTKGGPVKVKAAK